MDRVRLSGNQHRPLATRTGRRRAGPATHGWPHVPLPWAHSAPGQLPPCPARSPVSDPSVDREDHSVFLRGSGPFPPCAPASREGVSGVSQGGVWGRFAHGFQPPSLFSGPRALTGLRAEAASARAQLVSDRVFTECPGGGRRCARRQGMRGPETGGCPRSTQTSPRASCARPPPPLPVFPGSEPPRAPARPVPPRVPVFLASCRPRTSPVRENTWPLAPPRAPQPPAARHLSPASSR